MTRSFRRRLRGGEILLGTMVTIPDPAVAELLAQVGFDWLFIDGEHGPLGTAEILSILRAADRETACIVRVPAADETAIKRVLDLGATGIIVPQVNTAEQAAAVARATRYPPAGTRGIGLARAQGYGRRFDDYLASANDDVTVIVQAEHVDAVANIAAIAATDGIDAVFVGPYDLSASLGKTGRFDDEAVVEAIERVTRTCREAGMPLGFFGVTAEAIAASVERGYTLICAGVDALLLGDSAARLFAELERTVRDR